MRIYLRLLMLGLLFSFSSLCFAQERDSLLLRQEVSAGLGYGSGFDILAGLASFGMFCPGPEVHFQYLYNVNKCVGLGALGVFELFKGKYSKDYGTIITVNPTARFFWFNKQHFAMYSKIGIGIMVGIENTINIFPMINIAPVGIEFGNRKWRGYAEIIPIGTIGIYNSGIKYSF